MKKLVLIGFVLLFSNVYSQEFTLPTDLVEDFIDEKPDKINLDMIISSKIDENNLFKIDVKYFEKIESFKLSLLTYPNFELKLKNAIYNVIEGNPAYGDTLKAKFPTHETLKLKLPAIFSRIVTFHNIVNQRPIVATIQLKEKKIPIFFNDKDYENKIVDFLNDPIVEISFYGGFIEKIQVKGNLTVNSDDVVFKNKYSIGISSTNNIKQLSATRIFSHEQYSDTAITQFSQKTSSNYGITKKSNKKSESELYKELEEQYTNNVKKSLYIYVDAIIRYIEKVDVNANDISPSPQVIILDSNQKETKLYKEESTKLFEAVVFSDLLAIAEDEKSNGLIQIEVKKKFNLNTRRYDVSKYIFPLSYIAEAYGVFQNFEAKFQYSKIESSERYVIQNPLPITNDDNTTINSKPFYTNLDIYQKRNYAIGGNLNLLAFENQNAKLNMYLNIGGFFGRTGIKTSIDDEDGYFINHIEVPIEYQFHILPEKRISFTFSNKMSYFKILDSDINLKSVRNGEIRGKNEWLHSFNISLNGNLSDTGKLFIKYSLIHDFKNINNNFEQIQFGYSFFFLKKNMKKVNTLR